MKNKFEEKKFLKKLYIHNFILYNVRYRIKFTYIIIKK